MPEGPLNAIATYSLLSEPECFVSVIQEFRKYGMISIGKLGEVIAEFISLLTIFTCLDPTFSEMHRIMLQPLNLEKFFLALRRDKCVVDEFFKRNPLLVNSLVCFSYSETFFLVIIRHIRP